MIDLDALRTLIREEVEALTAPDADRDLFTVEEAAERLSMSRRTAYDRISEGRLQAVRDGGRLRVTRQAITDYVAALEAVEKPRPNPPRKPTSRRPRRQPVRSSEW